jgi:hypothetical protein
MAKFLAIVSDWAGGDTRQDPASLTALPFGGAKFDVGFGVGYVVRPGGGTTGNDAECIKSMTLTPDKFEVIWNSTGGQNHTIKLKFAADNIGCHVNSTGPKEAPRSQVVDQVTDNIGN